MKFIQVLPVFNYGDAIGNDVIALDAAMKKHGWNTEIYAELIDKRLKNIKTKSIRKWTKPAKDDVILYHMSVGWQYIQLIKDAKCRKIAFYHNITPPRFFEGYNPAAAESCRVGLQEVAGMADTFDYCFADSEFNKKDLLNMNYRCPIDVLPVLIAFQDYQKEPDTGVIERYKSLNGHNILFVGRVVPNKKYEDVISAFYMYKKYYDPDARLFLVGSYNEGEPYYRRLQMYIQKLGIKDIIFPGHIPFSHILSYYYLTDLFLCMSEHEGFCVPLVESMFFHKPIVAFDSTAIGDTLGGSGLLFHDKSYLEVAGLMNEVLSDDGLRSQIVKGQDERLKHFAHDVIEKDFFQYMECFLSSASAGGAG